MTTDTKAVVRWDMVGMLEYSERTGDVIGAEVRPYEMEKGSYVLFTDHERVVGELENYQRLTEETLADRHALVAILRAEVEGLKKDAERYAWLVGVLRHDYQRWAAVVDHNQANVSAADFGAAIDAAMEKGNV